MFPTFPATHSFPFVKKRIEVKEGGHREIVLTPIEVAIDEMQIKVADLKEAINSPVPDMKRLHLKLQGAVSAQVREDIPYISRGGGGGGGFFSSPPRTC